MPRPRRPSDDAGVRQAQARIDGRVLLVRGQKVMIDADLAELYGVPTKRLNEQVKRMPGAFRRTLSSS